MPRSKPTIGSGVYDLGEASYLLSIHEATLRGWASPTRNGKPLLKPSHGWAYSFHDLLSLAVIAVLRQRGLSRDRVAASIEWLQSTLQLDRPLASNAVVDSLRTAGSSVLYGDTDASESGQGVLLGTVEKYLRPVEYGADRLARLWKPAEMVSLDPEVQVGHPCVEGTRVTTVTVAGRLGRGEPLAMVAEDLELTPKEARAALKFETGLKEGRGLALIG